MNLFIFLWYLLSQQFHSVFLQLLHSVQSLPLPFPTLFSGMPCGRVHPKRQKTKEKQQ
jgi:hypothetical protein